MKPANWWHLNFRWPVDSIFQLSISTKYPDFHCQQWGMGGFINMFSPQVLLVESCWTEPCWSVFVAGWWFGTCFIFHNIWDNPSQLTNIFQRGWYTTNQFVYSVPDVPNIQPPFKQAIWLQQWLWASHRGWMSRFDGWIPWNTVYRSIDTICDYLWNLMDIWYMVVAVFGWVVFINPHLMVAISHKGNCWRINSHPPFPEPFLNHKS